jgi:hypothetical protein
MIRKLLYTAMKFNKYCSFIMLDCLGGDKHMLGLEHPTITNNMPKKQIKLGV